MQIEIYSNYQKTFLQKEISKLPSNEKMQLRNIAACGKRIIKPKYGQGGVFLMANGERAQFFGHTICRNSWCCPVCTPRRMARVRDKIGAVLDYLKDDLFGIMITFTIPHLRYMACRETADILYKTFTRFRQYGREKRSTKSENKYRNVVQEFFNEIGIKHQVVVCEYTYGKNGWHPHFHAIFWCKRDKASEVLKYEKALNDWWLGQAKKQTLKYWKDNNLHCSVDGVMETTLNNLYEKCEQNAGLMIGKKGSVINEALSGNYIAGWGAEDELSHDNLKVAHEGHYTPFQLLEKAQQGDEKALRLYFDYCLAVTRKPVHFRVNWSKTGLNQLAVKALQMKKYEELLKKKQSQDAALKNWQMLCWFDKEQWYYIRTIDADTNAVSNILFLATYHRNLLFEYMAEMGIGWTLPKNHFFGEHIENIFNGKEVA